MIDRPESAEPGEGEFEVKWAGTPKGDYELYDILGIRKYIDNLLPGKGEDLSDRVFNFRKLYINLATGEVTV